VLLVILVEKLTGDSAETAIALGGLVVGLIGL